ncbi:MAG TPA: hypothetical protein DCX54_10795 [Flavobacteriales bacterium]|nr:hypothetical protein [Flavobacteriales bacterium]
MLKKLFVLILISSVFLTCRKEVDSISTDSSVKLYFSDLVVHFDTIFTTVGSTTHSLRVYNPSNQAVNISSIKITGDQQAFFRMNVDGRPGSTVTNVFLPGKDSLYIFIDVTIDPSAPNLPFLIEGHIEFVTNGNVQEVLLLAYGQNAHFIVPDKFTKGLPPFRRINNGHDTTWTKDLPIVIYDYAVVDSNQRLTIEAGTQIYFHANSGLWVYRYGDLKVNGTIDEPVVFQGDRLDEYKDISGSWDRIWINDGNDPINFNYAIIKNAFIGIQAEYNPFIGFKQENSPNRLTLNNTKIENSKFVGLYATNFRIQGNNLLVSDAGESNLFVAGGGEYDFNNCTFANYYRDDPRSSPAVFLTHLYQDFEINKYREDSMRVGFVNCVIYGDKESEFNIEEEVEPGKKINFTMQNTLVKTNMDVTQHGKYRETIFHTETSDIFVSPYSGDFHLLPVSDAINAGYAGDTLNNFTQKDLDEKVRNAGDDLGAYVYE